MSGPLVEQRLGDVEEFCGTCEFHRLWTESPWNTLRRQVPPLTGEPCCELVPQLFRLLLFFTLNREDFSFVIHLDRQPRTSRRREAQTGSRARSGSRSERTLDAVEHSRTLMEWWPFLIFHRGGLRIKVLNNTSSIISAASWSEIAPTCSYTAIFLFLRQWSKNATCVLSRPSVNSKHSSTRMCLFARSAR